jgi:hypothetical protein
MKINKTTCILLLAAILVVATGMYESVLAQGGPPGPPGSGGEPPCWPPPCIPVNKGLIFLAFSAFLLASYKLKMFRSRPNSKM